MYESSNFFNKMFGKAIFLFLLMKGFFALAAAIKNSNRQNLTEVSITLTKLLQGYDTRIRPNLGGEPVKVALDFSVIALRYVQEVNMVYTIDMYFRQVWRDSRLAHKLNYSIVLMMGTSHPADYIWVPDTVFDNSVTSHMHHLMTNNHKIDIDPDGTVFWGSRATVTAMCNMDLRHYPMDTQTCHLTLVSYAYTAADLYYVWRSNPGVKLLDSTMAQFVITGLSTEEKIFEYVAGSYSTLTATFVLTRRLGYYMIQIYVPCIFIVLMASMSFWVDQDSTPARVGLTITTLLTISTVWGAVNASMPRVSYIKAIDWYLLISFLFVFCTFVEYVVVLNVHLPCSESSIWWNARHGKQTKKKNKTKECTEEGSIIHNQYIQDGIPKKRKMSQTRSDDEHEKEINPHSYSYSFTGSVFTNSTNNKSSFARRNSQRRDPFLMQLRNQARFPQARYPPSLIDVYSRFLFPFAFGVFNVVYWMTFYSQ